MDDPRVSFNTPREPEPERHPPGPYLEAFRSSTERTFRSEEILADVVISSERLKLLEGRVAYRDHSSSFFAELDGTSKLVIVERYPIRRNLPEHPEMNLKLAEALKVWKALNHPNVLELLGCSLGPEGEINSVIYPHLAHGSIRKYLKQTAVGVTRRLEFARDVTAGLDYLHSQNPPICHGNLNPDQILISDSLSAVLSDVGLSQVYGDNPTRACFVIPTMEVEEAVIFQAISGVGDVPFLKQVPNPCDYAIYSYFLVHISHQILTGERPYEPTGVLSSIFRLLSPGRPEELLGLVPEAHLPEHASTLRLLHSYIPLVWDYEPRKRPPISLLRRQVFLFSSEAETGDSVVGTLAELAHLLIPPDRLRIVERSQLGEGTYGEVVLGILDEVSSAPRDVAVKRLKAVGTRGDRIRLAKRLARELNIWAKISHPNVVDLIGYYIDDRYESPLLISALMTNGNVSEYIKCFNPDIKQRLGFVKGITAGLACLHTFNPPICHGDLKPANVLIDLDMTAVLCDFGLASFVGGSDSPGLVTTTMLKGTPRYMSPELSLDDGSTHSLESDVWAWACTVFQVLTGSIPYAKHPKEPQLCMAMVRNEPPGDIASLLQNNFEGVDAKCALVLRFLHRVVPRCWNFEPQCRPSMSHLLSQISNLSSEAAGAAYWSEGGDLGGSSHTATLPKGAENPSRGRGDHGEVAHASGQEDVPARAASDRKDADLRSSGDDNQDDDDRRLGGKEGKSDPGPRAKEEEHDALKAQLLALAAAIEQGSQPAGSHTPLDSSAWIRGIRNQLATVLRDIDHQEEVGRTAT
ncbi:hypothetical protein FRC01_000177 [Tulasnella sp. 417]|nr:hypothetical protein FRC01_000177 [Tulasnella sp. 417]